MLVVAQASDADDDDGAERHSPHWSTHAPVPACAALNRAAATTAASRIVVGVVGVVVGVVVIIGRVHER